jgi:hypothetical protein
MAVEPARTASVTEGWRSWHDDTALPTRARSGFSNPASPQPHLLAER